MARSDVQLMLDVKAGDEQSFALLLQRYRSPLVNFLYRMVRNREQAEDLAQEVFIRVYRAREDYVPSAKFTTWLFRIATNLALNSLRDTRHQRMEISLDAPVTADAEDGDDGTRSTSCRRSSGRRCCCTSIKNWIMERSRGFCRVRRVR